MANALRARSNGSDVQDDLYYNSLDATAGWATYAALNGVANSDVSAPQIGAVTPPSSNPSVSEATPVSYTKSGDPYIDGLLYGNPNAVRWSGTVSYSFPSAFSVYGTYGHTVSGFTQVSLETQSAVRSILGNSATTLGSNAFT